MALPDLIEIVPLEKPVRAEITVPGSKSITNRALILAALADGETILRGALWSEDTQIMVECLQHLGFMVNVEPDPAEPCNRTITVYGNGGAVPPGGTEAQPLDLFVGNAGTAARFLAPFLCLGSGVYRLHGVPRMHERPQASLFQALRELGYRVESVKGNDKLPVKIFGGSSRGNEAQTEKTENSQSLLTSAATKKCRVSIEESSQFASALLLCAKVGNWKVEVIGENAEESPYVAMTLNMQENFRQFGSIFPIDADTSSGSYFWAAGWLSGELPPFPIQVSHWPINDWQIDRKFPLIAEELLIGRNFVSRLHDLGDSIMTIAVLAPFVNHVVELRDLGRLRVQETERVMALQRELTKCGAKAIDHGTQIKIDEDSVLVTPQGEPIESEQIDTLEVFPSELHGAEIETYNDHRVAMCFAILGLKVPGIKIKNPACVKKTFPNFFQKLAAPPPHGLGAEIWEIKNGQRTRKLSGEDLFAD
jgi:3-phosphoshikimate 1-carboxyvinyltransferase